MEKGSIIMADQTKEAPDFIPDEDLLTSENPKVIPDFIPDEEFKSDEELAEEKYGTTSQMALTALESAGRGLAGPLAPAAERALGVDPEAIRAREEANPTIALAGEVAGFAAPALLTGGASGLAKFTQLGAIEAATAKLGIPVGNTLAAKIGSAAAKGAIENMMFAGSDEVSKMILNDPHQSAQTALSNIGLAGALGGALMGGFAGTTHGAAKLWEATAGDKASKLLHDFKARINEHIANPNPEESMIEELSNYHNNISSMADEVYGATGLKAQDIAKAVPELNEKIIGQMEEISSRLDKSLQSLQKDSHIGMLEEETIKYRQAIQSGEPSKIFDATQELKKQLQEWGKFNKDMVPLKERPFREEAKKLSHELRTALEDKKVWGKAAERQEAINKAFKEYLPTLKDFEKKFMVKVGDEKTIDPGKVATYLRQVGKPNAEIKQDILRNFLKSSEKYKKVIKDTHANLGIESPDLDTAMNVTLRSLDEQTLGSKIADALIAKGLSDAGNQALGASVGGTLSHAAGMHAGVGAILGAHILAPFFKSILPAIARRIFEGKASAAGLRDAVEYGIAVSKGEQIATKAVSNIFKGEMGVLPSHMQPTDREREKLSKQLREIEKDPSVLMRQAVSIDNYLPDNMIAYNQSLGNIVSYLNTLRPSTDRMAPLDAKPVPSTTTVAKYKAALDIAQQPLIVLEKIKNGTLTGDDIQHIGTMYPNLYNGLKVKLIDQVAKISSKNEMIPYKTRIGLSMFVAQPLDSTMAPISILTSQAGQTGQKSTQQMGQPKGVPSSPALQKMSQSYMTPTQTRVRHRQMH